MSLPVSRFSSTAGFSLLIFDISSTLDLQSKVCLVINHTLKFPVAGLVKQI